MKVKIYTHTRVRNKEGAAAYVIEAPEHPVSANNPVTKIGAIQETTRNEAEATCLLSALKRLRASSDIEIHTESGYIRSELAVLKSHEAGGYKNSKGERIQYAYIWEKIAGILDKQQSIEVMLDTNNEWTSWMHGETDRRINGRGQ